MYRHVWSGMLDFYCILDNCTHDVSVPPLPPSSNILCVRLRGKINDGERKGEREEDHLPRVPVIFHFLTSSGSNRNEKRNKEEWDTQF